MINTDGHYNYGFKGFKIDGVSQYMRGPLFIVREVH